MQYTLQKCMKNLLGFSGESPEFVVSPEVAGEIYEAVKGNDRSRLRFHGEGTRNEERMDE